MNDNKKTLREVTDKFNIFNDGRKFGANKRKYIIDSIKRTLDSEVTQELMKLGEAYGFYGHGRRRYANKLDISETEVVMVHGKPVVFDNVPSNSTIKCTIDNEGNVEHTQRIYDNAPGRTVADAIDNNYGGWSWATGGGDGGRSGNSYVSTFRGFDYVLQPNYISLNRQGMMLESIDDRERLMLESIMNQGIDEAGARLLIGRMHDENLLVEQLADKEREQLLLEGLLQESNGLLTESKEQVEGLEASIFNLNAKLEEKDALLRERQKMMLEACNAMPFYITDQQKDALLSMETEHDIKVVKAMFESLGSAKIKTLPLSGAYNPESVPNPQFGANKKADQNNIDFSRTPRFPK